MEEIKIVIDTFKELKPIMGRWLKRVNYEDMGEQDEAEFSRHMDIAIEALEKQIPKKVLDDGAFGICPICGAEFNSELRNEYNITYCCYCGQKLDWQ